MFTGLIEAQARVISNTAKGDTNQLMIESPFLGLQSGESIAVNGACLTLLPQEGCLAFDVSKETLKLTNLGQLKPGNKVNLERAMLAQGRMGGHFVNGHVDATAKLQTQAILNEYVEMEVGGFSKEAYRYLLPKGSITLDGVSLTINSVNGAGIKVMLVPHTLAHTTLGQLKVGQRLNVEFDYFTRIVAHQLILSGQLKSEVEL